MEKEKTSALEESSFDIYHELEIKVSIEKVFEAVSDPKGLINWWPLTCNGIPKLNQTYNFYFSDKFNWFGKVVGLNQNKTFYVSMTKSDSDWNGTTFGFDLNEDGNTVQVTFSHKGWPKCNEHFKRSSLCWEQLLNGLKQYLEKGIIIPFEERS